MFTTRSISAALLALASTACLGTSDLEDQGDPTLDRLSIGETNELCATLYAGQSIDAGSVCITTDSKGAEHFVVTYTTTGGWELTETHFWMGQTFSAMPTNKSGNPMIGHFPYSEGSLDGATTWTVLVPFADLGITDVDDCDPFKLYAAAHAAVRKSDGSGGWQTETGWAFGDRIAKRGSWATYFSFSVECSDDGVDGELEECDETAFAYGDLTFNDLGVSASWGWVLTVPAGTSGTADVWGGAGGNDTSAAWLTGTLSYAYGAGDKCGLELRYDTNAGTVFDEAHIHVGYDPTDTRAVGTFKRMGAGFGGEYDGATTDSWSFDTAGRLTDGSWTTEALDCDADVFVTFHAVARGLRETCE
jgi:hypothetical protein